MYLTSYSQRSAIICIYSTSVKYNGYRVKRTEGATEYYENATVISRNSIWNARGDGDAWMHTRVQSTRTVTRSVWVKQESGTQGYRREGNLIVTNSWLYLWQYQFSAMTIYYFFPFFSLFLQYCSIQFTLLRNVKTNWRLNPNYPKIDGSY